MEAMLRRDGAAVGRDRRLSQIAHLDCQLSGSQPNLAGGGDYPVLDLEILSAARYGRGFVDMK